MMDLSKEKIAVLAGGSSCEREISLLSGQAVYEAFLEKGLDVVLIDPQENFIEELKRRNCSIAFLALHGSFGEDGTIQRLLEKAQIIYTGSGPSASALAFDKAKSQTAFQEQGIPVPSFCVLNKTRPRPQLQDFKLPVVVKPASAGSSVGVRIVDSEKDYLEACQEAFNFSDSILIEEYIQGRELTVGILGEEVLPVVEVIPEKGFYDYEAKYSDAKTQYKVPASLNPEVSKKVQEIALSAYKSLGCDVFGRVDLILDAENHPYVLELNTLPGFTRKSLLPKAASIAGVDFFNLCARIIEHSLDRMAHAIPDKEAKK